ncbi:putative leucine-rich repeat-containing protein DDB_G0290503 [Plutella xylostella]|uniref:putative leucine-rich repeat-containing protein DDB_G0290503 n=1 Tax=Plutella xylostella TaxID=51655 RepID=UPI002032F8E5|nr:putative leucine-rich repeat-containing protein DDB_G0290503 [Plutella xylostella]
MEAPGMSLFQGAGSIHINNSAQDRLEEQEELEDQKRRNEELQHKLANAFDDLADDDEASSVNSSGNFTMDAGHPNAAQKKDCQRPGLPTYIESLNHLKEAHNAESPKPYCETPKNHHSPLMMLQEEPVKLNFSPYGAGDGQNHYCQQELRGHLNGGQNMNNYEARQEYMNNEQLKLMYEMRVKECQQLASQLEELRSQSDAETGALRARLAAAAAERDHAHLQLQQAHHLLASSKHKMVELEQQLTTVSEKLAENEHEKEQLRLELRSTNISLQEAQQRLHTMQVAHTHDTDALFREQQDRHREEIDRMHNDLQKAKNRLDEKENEIKSLEKRCKEREKEKEDILIEKGGTINRLARELEAAQSRLGGPPARDQLKELGSKLELTAQELVLCRKKLAATQKDFEGWRAALHQILAESLPDNTYLGEPPSPGKLSTLKEILSRQKQQLLKLNSLQDEIAKRDKRLEHHRKQESELRSKIEEQKGVEMQLTSRLAVLQNKLELLNSNSDSELLDSYKQQSERLERELEECRAECKNLDLKNTELELEYDKLKSEKGGRATLVQEANADLLKELERCSTQLKEVLKENSELKSLYLQACSNRDAVSREIKDIQLKVQKEKEVYKAQEKDYVERLEKEKQQVERVTGDLSSCKHELERANKRIQELQREFNEKQKEFSNKLNKYLEDEKSSIRRELESCAQCEKHLNAIRSLEEQINKCKVKLATQESNEELMQELKNKAEFFQKYIMERFQKLQEQRNVSTNTEPTATEVIVNGHAHNSSVEKEPSDVEDKDEGDLTSKTSLMMKEKEIRDQIAQKYTLEIKTLEMNCTKRLKEMENEHINSISKLKQLLEKKAQEVESLKNFILAERSKVGEILNSKENEISDLIKDHNSLQSEYQQLKDKAGVLKDRYQEKLKGIDDKYKSEREGYRKAMAEWEKEKETLSSRLTQLDAEYQVLKAKYKNAKKTAFMYKDYVEKKDEHVTAELSRIQREYSAIFLKMESRMQLLASARRDQHTGDYSEMLKRLQNEISALAQSKYEETPVQR